MPNTIEVLDSRTQESNDSNSTAAKLLEDTYVCGEPAQTNSAKKSWVDENYSRCAEQTVSTVQMVDCADTARNNWDGIMNDAYKTLQLNQTDDQNSALLQSQKQWLKFRNADFESIDTFASVSPLGSVAKTFAAQQKMEIVKLRAIEIQNRGGDFFNGSPAERGEKRHPIDDEATQNNMLYIDKLGLQYDGWDKQLNTIYESLKEGRTDEEKSDLKLAQREWLKYRDAEFEFLDKTTDHRYSGQRIENLQSKVDIVRQRAMQLESRFNSANGG